MSLCWVSRRLFHKLKISLCAKCIPSLYGDNCNSVDWRLPGCRGTKSLCFKAAITSQLKRSIWLLPWPHFDCQWEKLGNPQGFECTLQFDEILCSFWKALKSVARFIITSLKDRKTSRILHSLRLDFFVNFVHKIKCFVQECLVFIFFFSM